MSDCLTATHGGDNVRPLQRALSRPATQDKKPRVASLDDKGWRAAGRGEAWRQVQANKGAPGVDGMAIAWMSPTGDAEALRHPRHAALRAHPSQCAPVRVVERPQPQGGTRPRGSATGDDRVGQTARQLVLEPLFEADLPDCSYGDRPKREAHHASRALREALDNRAWRVVERAVQAYGRRSPHRQLRTLLAQRLADGSLLHLRKETRTVGAEGKGQGGPTQGGVPQGSPLSPWSRPMSLHRREQLWPSRGSPAKLGATLPRYADAAILVGRRSPQPVRAAFEGIAKGMERTLNRDKTRVTRVTDGFAVLGCNCGQRTSPRSGTQALDRFPAKSAQQHRRHRLTYVTSRRAPMSPKAFVERGNPMGMGWVNAFRHTNASQAFRGLQRFGNSRFRRDLTQRSPGRGFGWKRVPNRKRSAMGLASIGSGLLTYRANPAHGVR